VVESRLVEMKERKIQRIIGELHGFEGPTAVFTAGIHGNEPSGVIALQEVFDELSAQSIHVKGNIYMLAGNIQALTAHKRYIREDLNRIWTNERLKALSKSTPTELKDEALEQYELNKEINRIISTASGPLYFMDLHTTSSPTIPFMTVNDSLLNRKFTKQFPVPTILGIEEYLSGPILSYMNEEGYVAFGFEGGQHENPQAITNHKAFIYLSLYFSQVIDLEQEEIYEYINILKPNNTQLIKAFEIYHRHKIKENEAFKMEPRFKNFQFLDKDVHIATSKGREIRTTRSGRIFMPLYQAQGSEGFFAIQRIPSFFLWVSRIIRRTGFHNLFVQLPGITPSNKLGHYQVNRKKARFLTKQLIHLFGYRIIERFPNYYLIQSREMGARKNDYKNTDWY
jgi:hypothetical protein